MDRNQDHFQAERQKGTARLYFRMLGKAQIPYLWIALYLAAFVIIVRIGISATEYTAQMFAGNVDFTSVILPFLLVTLISIAVGTINGILEQICSQRITRNARRMLWRKVVHLPLRFYSENGASELITRITGDVSAVTTLIMSVFVAFLTTGYQSIALLLKIKSYDTGLMLAILAALPFEFLIAFLIGRLEFGVNDLLREKYAKMGQFVRERTSNYLLVKTTGSEETEQAAGEKTMKGVYRANILGAWLGFSIPMYAVAGMIQFLVIVLVGRRYYADGTLSLAQWVAYYGFANQLFNALSAYCGYWSTYKASEGAARTIAEIMDYEEEDVEAGKTAEPLSGDIVLSGVQFSYPDGKQVFSDLNLVIPSGKAVAVVGPSGSGKTTLLNLLERMYPAQGGEIRFGEQEIGELSLKSFRSQIAYLTQECTLFSGTIRENLLFGMKREILEEEILEACRNADLQDFLDECTLEFQVGENGCRLSGGQKQRLALARAFLLQSDYLFLDEATTAMDISGKDFVWEGIRKYQEQKDRSILFVAHDRQTVQKADYVIVLENGTVTAAGEPKAVAVQSGYYRNLIGEEEQS